VCPDGILAAGLEARGETAGDVTVTAAGRRSIRGDTAFGERWGVS
jgi:hypothetical protein